MKNGLPESRDEFFGCIVNSMSCRACSFQEICDKEDESGDGPRTMETCKQLIMRIYDKAEERENDI